MTASSNAGFEYEVLKKIDDQNKNIKLEYSTLELTGAGHHGQ